VDASAPNGSGGEWLLDPNNITINTTADANVAGSPDFITTNDSAVVTVASLQTALNAGTSVSITTGTAGGNSQNGDISVASSISKTAGGDATLTLKAHRNITVNNVGISSTSGKLSIVEFIPIKSSVTKGSGAPGNCAGRSRAPSPDHGPLASTGGCDPSRGGSA
jgi:hypothetical protein